MSTQTQAVTGYPSLQRQPQAPQGSNAVRNGTGNDLSAFGITLTFVFALVSMAAYSDRPAFWLLAGPAAIVTLFFTASLVHVGLLSFSKANRSRSGRVANRSKSLVHCYIDC
jgi:hypothetical protein